MGNCNLFIVGDSNIKRIERYLIVHHLSDKNISLKCENFDGADVRRIEHHLLPSLHKDQTDNIIIYGGTNEISHSKLHTIQPHDLAKKIINISNVCKSFGIASVAISSIFPHKDLELLKHGIKDENTLYNLSSFLKTLKTKNSKRLVFGNLNINPINNKFE